MHNKPKANQHFAPSQVENQLMDGLMMIKDGKANDKHNAHPRIGKDSSHDND